MDINNLEEIKKIDPNNMASSLIFFAEQCRQGWEEVSKMTFNFNHSDIGNIVACAMGGSLLGARVMKHVFHKELRIPFDYYAEYDVPGFVDDKTLAIIVSNSGNTEETLSSYEQAKKQTDKIIGIASGGRMVPLFQDEKKSIYIIDDSKYNPSKVPRFAVGFQIGAICAILSKMNLISLKEEEFLRMLDGIKKTTGQLVPEVNSKDNPAKKLAEELINHVPVLVASEHLFGSCKGMNNQINESGKNFSAFFDLPEVNHHQLEGMQFPESNRENLIYLLFESDLYHERNSKRYEILKNILDDIGIKHVSYKPKFDSKLGQALEMFQFGGYVTYYMGLLYEMDPGPNPFVDEFKKQLGTFSWE